MHHGQPISLVNVAVIHCSNLQYLDMLVSQQPLVSPLHHKHFLTKYTAWQKQQTWTIQQLLTYHPQ